MSVGSTMLVDVVHPKSRNISLNLCIKCKKFHMFRNRQGHSSRLIRLGHGQIWLWWPLNSIIWVIHFSTTFQSTINGRECTQLSHFWFPIEKKQNTFTSKLIGIHSFLGFMVKKMKIYMSNMSHQTCASKYNTSIRKIFFNTSSIWRIKTSPCRIQCCYYHCVKNIPNMYHNIHLCTKIGPQFEIVWIGRLFIDDCQFSICVCKQSRKAVKIGLKQKFVNQIIFPTSFKCIFMYICCHP